MRLGWTASGPKDAVILRSREVMLDQVIECSRIYTFRMEVLTEVEKR